MTNFGEIRTIETENGQILFCGMDIAKALGYSNPRKAIADHCKEKGVTKRDTLTKGGLQKLTMCTVLSRTVNFQMRNNLKVGYLMKFCRQSASMVRI